MGHIVPEPSSPTVPLFSTPHVSHAAFTLVGPMSSSAWDNWIFDIVKDRRDKVHHGSPTMIVLLGLSAVGKTTVARCLARRYGLASVDTNALKRGMDITHDQLLRHTEMEAGREWFVEIEGYYKYGWKGAAASASLSAVPLAAEAMDQGCAGVVAGLQNAWLRSFSDWRGVVARLVAPHLMFDVRLVVDPPVRMERLRQRSPGQWSWFPEHNSGGGESLTVDTTSVTPSDVADLVIKHRGIAEATPRRPLPPPRRGRLPMIVGTPANNRTVRPQPTRMPVAS